MSTMLMGDTDDCCHSGNVVLMTGATDYLSDGARTLAIGNGHSLLGQVTGVSLKPELPGCTP